ncbi:cobyric acid synthase [Oricola cellulosilytica]|uniref:Cobyric acid synthase n=1 Tax=Oricola cellulosilytica TaxID=1429082 RepID=A0A4V2MNW6_9HYPH|nr:cobyric acid synthase [Oricola cellulosilytica]TCD15027.1 cobyric acid synthase [Oricola cellulosilytica]
MTRAIMFQGTGSDVGKTVLVAGLCRALTNRGLSVRPFKPQNMSNNAAVAEDGGEIGRAQWLQAFACRTAPSVHMNPVLLKPQTQTGSQVVLRGKMYGLAKGRDYQRLKGEFLPAVMESFEALSQEADIVLVEGAGSPAEINLRAGDIANMGFATAANVPVVMVGDIDRGGVIASLAGTHAILPARDREMIKGYIINKFRGDAELFKDGLTAITGFTSWPCAGVLPWLEEVARLPAEDSVTLQRLVAPRGKGIVVAVPVLDRIANFDDLDPLSSEETVDLVMVRPGDRIPAEAALVVLPGSKSTIADLARFEENGWSEDLHAHVGRGGMVIGICGGFQMLGRSVRDPMGIEGDTPCAQGLGLLDVETQMAAEKRTENVIGSSAIYDAEVRGYEIHLGVTTGPDCARPATLIAGAPDGAVSQNGCVWGTYLHGIFDNGAFRSALLASLGAVSHGKDHRNAVDAALDAIATHMEHHLDVDGLLRISGQSSVSSQDKSPMSNSC